MASYTAPLKTTFELQRQTIKQSQRALESSVAFQRNVNNALIGSLDSSESAQRRSVEFLQTAVHQTLDAVEAAVPGSAAGLEEVRETIDEQYDALLESHAAAFDTVGAELEDGATAYDEFSEDYLEAVDEQLALLIEAHEDLESQSIEAVEQAEAGVQELQTQLEDVRSQVREVQEQVVDA